MQILYLPALKNIVADFLSHPSPPPWNPLVAADPVDFEAMAAEQNRCAETQRLLGGSSLQLAFRQAGTQCLAGYILTGIFSPHCSTDIQKRHLFPFSQYFTSGEVRLPAYGVF
jgi:hypothetical protein